MTRWIQHLLIPALLLGAPVTSHAQSPEVGLIAQYPFTGNTNDASGNGYNGTVVGATLTTDRDGNPNQAYAFNGTGARITLPNVTSLKRFNGSFTVAARVRPVASSNTVHTVLSNRTNVSSNNGGSRFGIVDGAVGNRRMEFTVKGGATAQVITGTTDVPLSTWSHVAVTFEFTGTGTNPVRLYLNGALDGSGTVGNILDPGTQVNLIGGENTPVSGIARFAGSMDEVRIYSRALTQPEVAALSLSDAPLPVELSSFTGHGTPQGVVLSWQTASERDNAGFSVVRDGAEIASFRATSALVGSGTTAQATAYRFTDAAVVAGRTYRYALRSTDRSGETHAYPQQVEVTVAAAAEPSTPVEFALYPASPNPFNPTTTIRFDLPEAADVTMQVFDPLGRQIRTLLSEPRPAGPHTATFDGAGLSSGVYLVRLTAVGGSGRRSQQAQRVLLAK